jgi:hypothetical protein
LSRLPGRGIRFDSLRHYSADPVRLVLAAVLISLAVGAVTYLTVTPSFGSNGADLEILTGGLGFYLVVSTPRRAMESSRLAQSRESVLLSEAGAAFLEATGSRTKTLMLLRSHDPEFEEALTTMRRRILLGFGPDEAAGEAAARLSSTTASNLLRELATMKRDNPGARPEEAEGLSRSSQLSGETKVPIFMTACFFTPIFLMLYASFERLVDIGGLIGLFAFEVIVLDLAFFLCANRGGAS